VLGNSSVMSIQMVC